MSKTYDPKDVVIKFKGKKLESSNFPTYQLLKDGKEFYHCMQCGKFHELGKCKKNS